MNHLATNERRNFVSRKSGLFRKAFQISQLFKAQVYVLIESESAYYSYSTDDNGSWPPNHIDIVSGNLYFYRNVTNLTKSRNHHSKSSRPRAIIRLPVSYSMLVTI